MTQAAPSAGRPTGLPTTARRQARSLLLQARSAAGRGASRLVNVLGSPPIGLKIGGQGGPAGSGGPDGRHDLRPVVLVLLFGAAEQAVAETVAALVRVAADPSSGRPLLVLDRPHFALPRRAGCAVEHVVDAATWQQRGEPGPWPAYLHTRLRQLRTDYAAAGVLVLPAAGVSALPAGVLEAGLTVPQPSGAAGLRQAWAARVERVIDR